jgi:hypothetical protein
MLVNGVARCLEAGRFRPAEPLALANQLWAVSHGVAALQLAGILDPDEAVDCLEAGGVNLLAGFGDEGDQLSASVDRARSRMSLR